MSIFTQINPKRELFVWGPIEGRVLYVSFWIDALWLYHLSLPPRVVYPWPWPSVIGLFEQGKMSYLLDDDALRGVGEKYFQRYFLNRKNFLRHWKRWEQWVERYQRQAQRARQLNWRRLTDIQLRQEFFSYWDLNRAFWFVAHVPEIANWGGERILKHMLKKIEPLRADEYLEVLCAPVQFSFFQAEELDLLKIAAIQGRARRQALAYHAEQYSWLLNSYGGNRKLNAVHFTRKLDELVREKNARTRIQEIQRQRRTNLNRKRALARRLRLNHRAVLITEQLSQSIWWQDLRKSYIWRMHEWLDAMLGEISRRTGKNFSVLTWCWPWEIAALLEGQSVKGRRIRQRASYYVQHFQAGQLRELYGQPQLAMHKQRYLEPRRQPSVGVCQGLVVSRSAQTRVRGVVAIIRNPFTDLKKMRSGNILVAPMTSPEFIVAMRKAAAIVTDHGGMTSHAAIVSRELKIPCIVGTKHATRVFKNGDYVEVDAERGIVRKLPS